MAVAAGAFGVGEMVYHLATDPMVAGLALLIGCGVFCIIAFGVSFAMGSDASGSSTDTKS